MYFLSDPSFKCQNKKLNFHNFVQCRVLLSCCFFVFDHLFTWMYWILIGSCYHPALTRRRINAWEIQGGQLADLKLTLTLHHLFCIYVIGITQMEHLRFHWGRENLAVCAGDNTVLIRGDWYTFQLHALFKKFKIYTLQKLCC